MAVSSSPAPRALPRRAGALAGKSTLLKLIAGEYRPTGGSVTVDGVLDRLGLTDVTLPRRLHTLSGGQVVSLGLAAQLLARPDVLLLDEPTTTSTW